MTIAHTLVGTGERLLFVQGVGVPSSGWSPQIDALSSRFACASFDNRGVGKSSPIDGSLRVSDMVADTLSVLDALGWENVHVIGHSLGGVVAQELALTARTRVKSLVLMCTFARGKDAARFSPWIFWTGLRSYVGTRSMRRRAFLEIVLPPDAPRDDAVAAKLAPIFGRDLGDPSPAAMAQLRAASKHDVSARLPELAGIRTLVISGEHDRLALPAYGRAIASAIPGARYEEIRGAAHGAPITHAGPVNALLEAHCHE
ncbi:MAG: alpha/beta fold hydrolase [Polyangiales bacterium]